MKKIVVTGSKGKLGSELVKHKNCFAVKSDILNSNKLESEILKIDPDVVINCAAITDVDYCETTAGYDKAINVNYKGVIVLLDTCRKLGCKLLHISTDYVFDGVNGAYKENNETLSAKTGTPVNNYGWSKLGGESLLFNDGGDTSLVIRTTGLYGITKGHNFFLLVKNKVGIGRELFVTEELFGNQTYIPHLVKALLYIANYPELFQEHRVLHVASKEVISRYDFALRIADEFGYDKSLIMPVQNHDISSWVAKRPTHGGLIITRAQKLGIPIYTIDEGINDVHKYYNSLL